MASSSPPSNKRSAEDAFGSDMEHTHPPPPPPQQQQQEQQEQTVSLADPFYDRFSPLTVQESFVVARAPSPVFFPSAEALSFMGLGDNPTVIPATPTDEIDSSIFSSYFVAVAEALTDSEDDD